MDDFTDDDIRQDIENKVVDFIKTNTHMKAMVTIGKQKDLSIAEFAEHLKKTSNSYAHAHGKRFGDLFQDELEMVEWVNLVGRVYHEV